MNKIISFLVVTSVMGPAAFAIPPSQVTDGRGYLVAIAANQKITQYMNGKAKASPEIFYEILNFLEQIDTRPQGSGLNPRATELLRLAEEVASYLPTLSDEWKEQLRPIMNSLLQQYPLREKATILIELFDRYWLWSPENLTFLAMKVRSDDPNMISTQLLWVLERANDEQRDNFFEKLPMKNGDKQVRWFRLALAFRYGRAVDRRELKRYMNMTSIPKLRPLAKTFTVGDQSLSTTADLFTETQSQLETKAENTECVDEFAS